MNESKRLIKNTGIIAIGNLSTKLVSFLLLPMYTSLLSAEDYGNFDYLVTLAVFIVPFVSVLMEEAIFRFLIDCKGADEMKCVISTTFVIVVSGMVLFAGVGIPIMLVLRYQFTGYAAMYVLASVVCSMLSAFLRGIGWIDQYALFNFLSGSAQVILNVLFIAVFRMGLQGMIYAALITQFTVSVGFILKCRLWKYIDMKAVDRKLAKEMVVYALPLIPNRVSWNIINLSDRLIMMNTLGSNATGIYAVAHKFPNLMDMVYGFFYQSWKESSARVMGDVNQAEFYNDVYSNLKNVMYAIVIGMIAFMPAVFRLLINDAYYEAIYYVPILILAIYFSNISGFYGGIFTAYKDTNIMGITTMVSAIIGSIMHIALIKAIGMYAAAISALVANWVVYFYRKQKVKKYVQLKENHWKTVAAMVITIIVLVLYYSENVVAITVACGISIVYAAVTNRSILMFLIKS